MTISTFSSARKALYAIGAVTLLVCSQSVADDDPAAGATPQPGTLAAYAKKISLNSSALRDENGRLTLTNENMAEISAQGTIILGVAVVAPKAPNNDSPGNEVRAKWRKAHARQRDAIAALERRRALLKLEIDHIENGRLDVRGLARLERAEAKHRLLEKDIRDQYKELAKIVREARRHGAQPDWFR